MKPWRFCPACGTELEPPNDDGGARCPSCERTWWRHSAVTAGAAIVRDGRVLVTVRAGEPHKGRIDVPGGFLGYGEDPVDGLKREVKEELDVTIETAVDDCLSMAVHRYGDDGEVVLALGFAARLIAGDPHPRDDVADALWVTEADLDDLDFAWPHDRELVRKALAHGYG